MSESFKKRQLLFMVQLLIGAALLYLLHTYLLNALQTDYKFVIPLWNTYLFHFISVLIVYSIINFRFANGKVQVFNPFILLMILKMFLVVIFLLPLFLSEAPNKVSDAINFFIPYFIFLAFEVYSINQFLAAK
ncbi:hypothetical protein MTsPCn9_14940 [Croceitalea sp. MTPC9]|uniref:hypothetical protein n=1 Tax=unclassified Croceitalea TaxID=2632280 RepID=UPI002B3BA6B4|nr:hypothetical protein MTsPCn6_14190 [Croceitalea sp. MTPC6]GMN16558.1 hypothetical protein MTsPCn9_14940 [Croceitalea sp. MTPC9]